MTQITDAQSLIDLLTRLDDQLDGLDQLLEQEQTALVENQFPDIERIAAEKSQLTEQVEQSEQARHKLCQQLQISPDFEGIRRYVTTLAQRQRQAIVQRWESIIVRGQRCASQNQLNGILVANQQRRTREALAILRGNGTSSESYSHSGAHQQEQMVHSLGKV